MCLSERMLKELGDHLMLRWGSGRMQLVGGRFVYKVRGKPARVPRNRDKFGLGGSPKEYCGPELGRELSLAQGVLAQGVSV